MKSFHIGATEPSLLVLALTVGAALSQLHGCQTPEGLPGECKDIRQCPSILSVFLSVQSGTAGPDAVQKLRAILNSRCSGGGGSFTFCCPLSSPPPNRNPPVPPRTSTEAPATLPESCGMRALVDRVISGEDAKLLAWPWMALLEATGPDGRGSFICGGVLISEFYVLTAAHCVDEAATGFTLRNVRLGEHTISTNPDCQDALCAPDPQVIPVGRVKSHEDYGKPFGCRNCNDIALIRLARPANLENLYVQPICIPQNLPNDLGFSQGQFDGRPGWVAGWGTTDPDRIRPADVLQQVQLPFNSSLCSIDLRVFPNQNMALCAGGRQQDTCRGDSGGPMVMSSSGGLKNYVVGIVSRGPVVCGAPNTGGIYTNVNFYVPWILRNL